MMSNPARPILLGIRKWLDTGAAFKNTRHTDKERAEMVQYEAEIKSALIGLIDERITLQLAERDGEA